MQVNDEELHKRARMLWSFGETRTPVESRDYHVYAMGWMYRNNDLTAAFGRAQLTRLDGYLTLTSDQAARAARILSARTVIPLHTEGCAHITEGPGTLQEAFASHGLAGQLTLLAVVGRFRGRGLVLVAVVSSAVFILIAGREFWINQLGLILGSGDQGALQEGVANRLTGDTG